MLWDRVAGDNAVRCYLAAIKTALKKVSFEVVKILFESGRSGRGHCCRYPLNKLLPRSTLGYPNQTSPLFHTNLNDPLRRHDASSISIFFFFFYYDRCNHFCKNNNFFFFLRAQRFSPIKLAYFSKVSKMLSLSLRRWTLGTLYSPPFRYQTFHYELLRGIIKND